MSKIAESRWFDFLVKGFLVLFIVIEIIAIIRDPDFSFSQMVSIVPKALLLWGFWTRKEWARNLSFWTGLLIVPVFYLCWFYYATAPTGVSDLIVLIAGFIFYISIGVLPVTKKYLNKKGRKEPLILGICCLVIFNAINFTGIFKFLLFALSKEPVPVIEITNQTKENLPKNWKLEVHKGWQIPIPQNSKIEVKNDPNKSVIYKKFSGTNLVAFTWFNESADYIVEDNLGIRSLEESFKLRTRRKPLDIQTCLLRLTITGKEQWTGFKKEKDFSVLATFFKTEKTSMLFLNIEPKNGEKFDINLRSDESLTRNEKIALISHIKKL